MNSKYLMLLIITISFIGCVENEIEEPTEDFFNYDYFEVDQGFEWIYAVDSLTIFQGGSANEETSSFVREQVGDLLIENGEEKTFELIRSWRKTENDPWQITDIWAISIDNDKVIRTEENLSFVKMVFPVSTSTKWNGNILFDSDAKYPAGADNLTVYQGWSYEVQEIDEPYSVGENTYPETLLINHIDEEFLINRRYSEERYARDIGLIERKMQIFDTQNTDTSMTWEERAQSGFQLTQRLISFSR